MLPGRHVAETRMLNAGDRAPDFSNPDADMNIVELSQFRGKTLVLYFYVRDDTPGCTTEAIEFSELENDFAIPRALRHPVWRSRFPIRKIRSPRWCSPACRLAHRNTTRASCHETGTTRRHSCQRQDWKNPAPDLLLSAWVTPPRVFPAAF